MKTRNRVPKRSKLETEKLARLLKFAARNSTEMHQDSEVRNEAAIRAHKQAKRWAKGKGKWPHPIGYDRNGTAYYHKPDMTTKYCQALYGNTNGG